MDTEVLWLVPIAYGLHIVEEAPRFVRWTKRYPWLFTDRFTNKLFAIGNVVFMFYVLAAVSVANSQSSKLAFVLGLSTAAWIFSNSLIHIILTLVSGVYSPGLVTASGIYVPLSIFIYAQYWRSGGASLDVALWSILVGFAVMYVPQLNAVRVARAGRARRVQQM